MTDMREISAMLRKLDAVQSAINDALTQHSVSPQDGERLLALLAGMSVGIRAGDVIPLTEYLAIGFQLGATHGGDFE